MPKQINVQSRSQRIVIQPGAGHIEVLNLGPIGPGGPAYAPDDTGLLDVRAAWAPDADPASSLTAQRVDDLCIVSFQHPPAWPGTLNPSGWNTLLTFPNGWRPNTTLNVVAFNGAIGFERFHAGAGGSEFSRWGNGPLANFSAMCIYFTNEPFPA